MFEFPKPNYTCKICKEKFENGRKLALHIKMQHKDISLYDYKKIHFNKDDFKDLKGFKDIMICLNCGKPVKEKVGFDKFRFFCCNQCSQDYQVKYGLKDISNKKGKKTKLEKYGDPNYVNSEKATKTKDLKDPNRLIFSKKLKKTLSLRPKEKTQEIVERTKKTNLKRYGCENVFQNEKIKEKIKKSNLKRYGVQHYNQKHFTNIQDLNKDFILENFVKDCKFQKDEFMDYFNTSIAKVQEIKKEFDIQVPNKVKNCKTQQDIFDSINITNKILNDRSVISPYELDIVLPDYKLAIEYDGLLYHSQGISSHQRFNTPDFDKNYHLEKTKLCEEKSYQLLHIFEGENIDLWLSMINSKLNLNTKIYARKCFIKEIDVKSAREFCSENHLQGHCNAGIYLGIFTNLKTLKTLKDISENSENSEIFSNSNNEILVGVMTFGKPRFNSKYEYELIRFCTLKGYTIIGGASKLLKYFERNYNPKSIISYANRRFSNGKIYEKLGFIKQGYSQPNYFYFNDSLILESRNKYQKHKLKDTLEFFNENLTEVQNMFINGYRRIFDSGNIVFVKNFLSNMS